MNLLPYIGIEYTDDFKCWDLVRLFLCEQIEVDVGPVDEQTHNVAGGKWNQVQLGKEQCFDVLVFRDGIGTHVGVVLGDGKFLHTFRGGNSCIESYKGVKWRNKIRNIYRHKSLTYTVI